MTEPRSDGSGAAARFAAAIYAVPGIERACLDLQDHAGLDVVLILFAGWLAHRGWRLDSAAAGRLCAAARPWQETVVRPLRQIRRDLRGLAGRLGPGLAGDGEVLREEIARCELLAEWIEFAILERLATELPPTVPLSDKLSQAELLTVNLDRLGCHPGAHPAALDAIAAAALAQCATRL